MAEIWGALAVAVVGAGTAVYSSQQQKKAADKALQGQRGLAENLKYEPIDIDALKLEAQQTAIENATNSLALERSLQPDVADTRTELARQVKEQLYLGGKLPTDVSNRVTTAGRTLGARSGVGSGGTVPLTASLLGLSSIDLANSRRSAAGALMGANPLPVSGLDPGAVADVAISNNNALNEVDMARVGVNSNLINSEAAARAAQIGGQVGMVSSLAGLVGAGAGAYGAGAGTTNYGDLLKKVPKTGTNYGNQNPATNPLMSSSPLGLA